MVYGGKGWALWGCAGKWLGLCKPFFEVVTDMFVNLCVFIETKRARTANTSNTVVVTRQDLFLDLNGGKKREPPKPPFWGSTLKGGDERRRKKHGFPSQPPAHAQGPNIPLRGTPHSDQLW